MHTSRTASCDMPDASSCMHVLPGLHGYLARRGSEHCMWWRCGVRGLARPASPGCCRSRHASPSGCRSPTSCCRQRGPAGGGPSQAAAQHWRRRPLGGASGMGMGASERGLWQWRNARGGLHTCDMMMAHRGELGHLPHGTLCADPCWPAAAAASAPLPASAELVLPSTARPAARRASTWAVRTHGTRAARISCVGRLYVARRTPRATTCQGQQTRRHAANMQAGGHVHS